MDLEELNVAFLALQKQVESLAAAIDDTLQLQASLLESVLNMFPAKRGAILLNGPRASGDPEDFVSGIYGERGIGLIPHGFEVSGKALKFVYANREACMSNDAMPALMCAPLITANGAIIGVIYLDTSELGTFEMDELGMLRKISKIVAKLIRDSLR